MRKTLIELVCGSPKLVVARSDSMNVIYLPTGMAYICTDLIDKMRISSEAWTKAQTDRGYAAENLIIVFSMP